ncbi:hypothetical protein J6590_014675 [Homalodisca vitripennis]|nr:hypothetical protein J6590_014675 [Homalodisca vitripennis]
MTLTRPSLSSFLITPFTVCRRVDPPCIPQPLCFTCSQSPSPLSSGRVTSQNLEFSGDSVIRWKVSVGDKEKPFRCDGCGRSYAVLYCLQRHQRYECAATATAQRQFTCHLCSRRFNRADILRVHINRHSSRLQS